MADPEPKPGNPPDADGPAPTPSPPKDPAPAPAASTPRAKAAAKDAPAAPAKKEAAPPEAVPPKQDNEETRALVARFGDGVEQVEDTAPSIPMFLLKDAATLVEVATFLQRDRSFEHLSLITSVDYKDRIEVLYNFWSYSKNQPFGLKVQQGREAPVVPSLTGLWATAEWQERENFDLMGVRFEGHPDLRRILLPEGWRGHPLRKDYEWKREQYVAIDPESGDDVVYAESREGAW